MGWLRLVVMFAAGGLLTIAASSISHRFVEVPMIRVGRRLAANLAARLNGPIADGARRTAPAEVA